MEEYTYYADGLRVSSEKEAFETAKRVVRIELYRPWDCTTAYTDYDVRPALERGGSDRDRIHRGE